MPTIAELCAIPIDSRPSTLIHRPLQLVIGTLCLSVFQTGCIATNSVQLLCSGLFLPLTLVGSALGFEAAQKLQHGLVRLTKGAFCALLVLTTQWFAPTQIVLTLEGDNLVPENVLVTDTQGILSSIDLPKKLILMANHQVYLDWIYVWCLTYYLNIQLDMYIMLKQSLKWLPIVGWGMQVFGFLFMSRSWAKDKGYLARKLSALAKRADQLDEPLSLLVFPEGTLVSKDTRPLSKKYADKIGIPDTIHTLLPRSTGLLYTLRALSPRIPSLHLLDITVAYPGIPRLRYGQDYYTMRSVLLDGVAPSPAIRMHLKLYHVKDDVPLGSITLGSDGKELEVSDQDRLVFEEWLHKVWRDKDERYERFYETGSFATPECHTIPEAFRSTMANGDAAGEPEKRELSEKEVVLPVKLRSNWEILDAFSLPGPLAWAVITGSK